MTDHRTDPERQAEKADLKRLRRHLERLAARAEAAEAEVKRLRRLCGEVWAWDRSKEREAGLVPGPLNVALRLMLFEASEGALSNVEEDCSND